MGYSVSSVVVKQILANRDRLEDNPWRVWHQERNGVLKLLTNEDGSFPYVRQVDVSNKLIAFDSNINISSEVYRVTLVRDNPPSANDSYWIGTDLNNKYPANFCEKRSRCKRSYWWLFLKVE